MELFKNLAMLSEVLSDNEIKVLVIGEDGEKILKCSKEYSNALKILEETEEIVFVEFDPITDEVKED